MASPNDALLEAIRRRGEKQTKFRYGIITADRYVKTIQDHIGLDRCYYHMAKGNTSYDDLVKQAQRTLAYSNEDMEGAEVKNGDALEGLRLPKNCLMVFSHCLSSSRKDRDGDVLHSDGASVDPKLLMLWQHVHTMPVGKLLVVQDKNPKRLTVVSCIVDMNDLCHDAAVMVDNGMARFSHGFRATKFTQDKEGREGKGEGGFDVKEFEIMEESLVSVPANVDASVDEVLLSLVESKKLTSPILKDIGHSIREHRNIRVPVPIELRLKVVLEQPNSEKVSLIQDETNLENDYEDKSTVGEGAGEGGSRASASEEADAAHRKAIKAEADQASNTEVEDGEGLTSKAKDEDEEEGNGPTCPECGYEGEPDEDGNCPKCGTPMVLEGETDKEAQGVQDKAMELASTGPGALGSLEGSWEEIVACLRDIVKRYLALAGISFADTDWVWILGTYPDHVIVSLEHGSMAKREYYRIDWEMRDGKPVLIGEPTRVEVNTITEILERSFEPLEKMFYPPYGKPYPGEHAARIADPDKYKKIRRQNNKFAEGVHAIWGVTEDGKTELQAIRFSKSKFTEEEARKWLEEHKFKLLKFEPAKGEEEKVEDGEPRGAKAGRVLSKRNEGLLRKAKEHVDDVGQAEYLQRSHGAQLHEASGHLKTVLETVTEAPTTGPQALSIAEATVTILTKAESVDRKRLLEMLVAIEKSHEQNCLAADYTKAFGS